MYYALLPPYFWSNTYSSHLSFLRLHIARYSQRMFYTLLSANGELLCVILGTVLKLKREQYFERPVDVQNTFRRNLNASCTSVGRRDVF